MSMNVGHEHEHEHVHEHVHVSQARNTTKITHVGPRNVTPSRMCQWRPKIGHFVRRMGAKTVALEGPDEDTGFFFFKNPFKIDEVWGGS